MLALVSSCFTVQAQILQAENLWQMGRVDDIQVSPDGQWVLYGITRYDLNENKGNRDLYVLPVAGGDSIRVTDFEGNEFNGLWRPDGKKSDSSALKTGHHRSGRLIRMARIPNKSPT